MFDWIFSVIKRHTVIIRLVIVIVLFTVLFYNIHPRKVVAAFGQAKPIFLLFASSLLIPNILLQIFKWNYIVRTHSPKPNFKTVAVSVLGGFFLGASSPGRTGELARGVLMPGHSLIKIASLTIVDKGFNQVIVVIVGLFSLMLLLPWPMSLLLLAGDLILLIILFNIHRLKPGLERFLNKFTHSERVDNALAAFDALSLKKVLGMLAFSIAFYLVYVTQFYLMILSFVHVPLIIALKTLPIVYLIQLTLPVSFGDFGIKEMATVKLLVPFGIAGEFLFSATLTNNVITFFFPAICRWDYLCFLPL